METLPLAQPCRNAPKQTNTRLAPTMTPLPYAISANVRSDHADRVRRRLMVPFWMNSKMASHAATRMQQLWLCLDAKTQNSAMTSHAVAMEVATFFERDFCISIVLQPTLGIEALEL